MTFPVNVIYILKGYTYLVETTDWVNFTCRLQPSQHCDDFSNIPKLIELKKGEEPKLFQFGQYQAKLRKDLLEGIQAFFDEHGVEWE